MKNKFENIFKNILSKSAKIQSICIFIYWLVHIKNKIHTSSSYLDSRYNNNLTWWNYQYNALFQIHWTSSLIYKSRWWSMKMLHMKSFDTNKTSFHISMRYLMLPLDPKITQSISMIPTSSFLSLLWYSEYCNYTWTTSAIEVAAWSIISLNK